MLALESNTLSCYHTSIILTILLRTSHIHPQISFHPQSAVFYNVPLMHLSCNAKAMIFEQCCIRNVYFWLKQTVDICHSTCTSGIMDLDSCERKDLPLRRYG